MIVRNLQRFNRQNIGFENVIEMPNEAPTTVEKFIRLHFIFICLIVGMSIGFILGILDN